MYNTKKVPRRIRKGSSCVPSPFSFAPSQFVIIVIAIIVIIVSIEGVHEED